MESPTHSPHALKNIGYLLADQRAQALAAKIQHLEGYVSAYSITRAVIFLTNQCNLACRYCNSIFHPMPPWSDAAVFDLIHQLAQHQNQHVHWTGGEPSLNPRLPDFVAQASSLNMNCSISTNLTFPAATYLELVQAGMSRFYISLDSLSSQKFDYLTHSEGHLKTVIQNIQTLVQNQLPARPLHLTLNVTLNSWRIQELLADNAQELKSFLEWIMSSQVNDFKFLPIPEAKGQANLTPTLLNRFLDQCARMVPSHYEMFHHRLKTIAGGGHGFKDASVRHCYHCFDDRAFDSEGAYGCIIQLREGGAPVYLHHDPESLKIERLRHFLHQNRTLDPICREFCFDLYQSLNDRVTEILNSEPAYLATL